MRRHHATWLHDPGLDFDPAPPRAGDRADPGPPRPSPDQREKASLGTSMASFYGAAADWQARLHAALGVPSPCPATAPFEELWEKMTADLTAAGLRVGIASYGGWNDGDRAFSEAIWCIVAHTRPERVVETGVAHGLTSRIILEGLESNGAGCGASISPRSIRCSTPRSAWPCRITCGPAGPTSAGQPRQRLPHLLSELGTIDLFVHDSLHTGRNTRFELDTAWPAIRPGGAVVVDDIDHSLGFHAFVQQAHPAASATAAHVAGDGLWGLAIKAKEGAGDQG